MFPEVWSLVTGGGHRREPARIEGFNRRRRRGEVYPVVYPGSESVEGVLYYGLSAADWRRLDEFEGSDYQRRRVAAVTGGGQVVAAWAYLLRGDLLDLADGPWDPDWFRRWGLRIFLEHYRGFQTAAGGEEETG